MSGTEEWRLVVGGSDMYEVSSLGRVRSIMRGTSRVLTPVISGDGYHRYGLSIDGKRRQHRAHRLVAAAFLGEPTGPLVRHLDGDPTNNRVSNLAYGDQSDNMRDSLRHGTHAQAAKTHCSHGHPFDEANTAVYSKGRRCLACSRVRSRLSKARLRAITRGRVA